MSNLKKNSRIGQMKRLATLAIIATLTLLSSHSYGQLLVGVRGGYSVSGITFTPERDTKPLTDPLIDVGLILKVFDLEHVGFQGEVNYTQRGYISYMDSVTLYKRLNSYIDVPVFFQVRAAKNNFFGHINVGFYASLLSNSKVGQGADSTQIELSSYPLNILRDNYFDLGLRGGVGTGYDFSWGTIQFDLRYTYGYGDLYYYNYAENPTRSPVWSINGSLSLLINLSKTKKEKIIIEDNNQFNNDLNQI